MAADCVASGRFEPGARGDVTVTHTPRSAERAESWVELGSDAANAPLLRMQAIGVAPAAPADPSPAPPSGPPEEDRGGGAVSAAFALGLVLAVVALRCWGRKKRPGPG